MLRRDARTMRAMLDFRSAARNEGLSPEQRRERLEREDMPEDVRAALCDELERGEERMPDEQNMNRAMNLLRFTPNKPAGVILGVVRSALANAEHNASMDVDALVVKEILVNEGPTWKRFMPRAQGRATNIHKRTSHITVILAEGQE